MKYLLILLAVLAGVYLWRSSRSGKATVAPETRPAKAPALQDMVRCATCTVHLPQSDAVHGKQVWYCCDAHRRLGES